MELIKLIQNRVNSYRFDLYDEKILQQQLFDFVLKDLGFVREFRLDSKNIVDFYNQENKLAIEIKIQGSPAAIYRQIARYCEFQSVATICLITVKTMGLPSIVNEKPTTVISLGRSWL